jgi:hypothetical protein
MISNASNDNKNQFYKEKTAINRSSISVGNKFQSFYELAAFKQFQRVHLPKMSNNRIISSSKTK